MSAFEIVPFQNDQLEALREGDDVFVSLRRMCDALGVDTDTQRRKLAKKPWANTVMKTAVAEDGKAREVVCLHLESVPMWLATIEPSRVAEAVRPKLRGYQVECARVLRDHFFGRPTPPPSGGNRGSGGGSLMTRALHAMVQLSTRQDEMERRVALLEARALPASIPLLPVLRKAYDVDVRGNVRRLHGDDPDGAHNRSANSFIKFRLGKKRRNWLERDFSVACVIAEGELGFSMSATRALLPTPRIV